jgi:ferredoxin
MLTLAIVAFLFAQLSLLGPVAHALLSPCLHRQPQSRRILTKLRETKAAETGVEQDLMDVAHRLKLKVFDTDDGVYGLESKDNAYGIQVLHPRVTLNPGLGLVLTEVASASGSNKVPDNRGLVLVREVLPEIKSTVPIKIGDVITGVKVRSSDGKASTSFQQRTTGLNYDATVEIIAEAKAVANGGAIDLEIQRLVPRASVRVEVFDSSSENQPVATIDALAGENLRTMLLRNNIKLYDKMTKRFDMPYATGDCAGDGLCGTCLVRVISAECEGGEHSRLLNDKDDDEHLITRDRPLSWRAACRTYVGAENLGGTLKIALHPQSGISEEIDPGVRSVQ